MITISNYNQKINFYIFLLFYIISYNFFQHIMYIIHHLYVVKKIIFSKKWIKFEKFFEIFKFMNLTISRYKYFLNVANRFLSFLYFSHQSVFII